MENRIDLKIENHIAHAHMIRADKMNALDAEMTYTTNSLLIHYCVTDNIPLIN